MSTGCSTPIRRRSIQGHQPGAQTREYDIAHHHDKFYIRTNLDARNFRLMVTDEFDTSKKLEGSHPHREEVLLEDMDIFEEYLVLSERQNGITQLRIRQWKVRNTISTLEKEAYMVYVSINPDFDTDWLRIGYTSLTTPNTTYHYNMKTRG